MIGSVEFEVTQPRQPCNKLSVRFGRDDIVKRFLLSGSAQSVIKEVEECGVLNDR